MSERDAGELIEKIQRKYRFGSVETTAALKEEILARPPLVMTPEMEQREKDLASERQETLSRRIQAKHG